MTSDRLAALIGLAESRCETHADFEEAMRELHRAWQVIDTLQAEIVRLRGDRCCRECKERMAVASE